ncbi:MAG: ABC transporter permease [Acetobacteraceae bacterium]
MAGRAEVTVGLGIAGVVLWLSVLPLGRLVIEAMHHGAAPAWRPVITALGRSVVTSVGGGAVSLVLGTGYAVAATVTDAPARRLLAICALLPLLIPAQIIALAWMQMLAGIDIHAFYAWLYSPAGVILLLGIEHIPIVFLTVRAAIRSIPAELVEAARAGGVPARRVFSRIILPLATPGLAAGFGLSVLSCLGSFGIPAMIGIPARYTTLAVLIYQRLSGLGASALPEVAAMALCLAAVSGLAAAAVAGLARGVDTRIIGGAAGGSGARLLLGRGRAVVAGTLLTTAVVTVLLPLLSLVSTSLSRAYGTRFTLRTATMEHYASVLRTPEMAHAFATSATLAVGTAAIAMILAVPLAVLCVADGPRWLRALYRGLDPLIDAPYALPGIVLAIGMILLYLPPLPLLRLSLYGTPWIMLLAYVARFLPLGLRPVQAALSGIDPILDEAARAQGAGFLRRLTVIAAPLLTPAAAGAATLVLLTAFGELTVSALLWSPGNETVGVLIFSLNEGGDIAGAAAVSVMCLAVVFAVAGMTALLPAQARRVLPWAV